MGTVFQILPGHDLPDQCQQFCLVIHPARLDGGLAGNCVENFIPDGGLFLPAAVLQVGGQRFDSFRCQLGREVHGDLPQDNGILAEFVDFKTQFVQHFPVLHQFADGHRGKADGDGGE